MQGSPETAEARRRDDLRRALYRAGATEADLRRYLDEEPEAGPGPGPSVPAPRRRPRRALLGVGAAVVLLGALVVGVRLEQSAATGSPVAASPIPVVSVGDSDASVGDATAVLSPARAVVQVDGAPVGGFRFEGEGSAVLPFDPPRGSYDGGRAVVALATSGPDPIVWRALRQVIRQDWTSFPQVVAQGTGRRPFDLRGADAFSYRGLPPSRIVVEAPAGTRWLLVVAVTGAGAPESR